MKLKALIALTLLVMTSTAFAQNPFGTQVEMQVDTLWNPTSAGATPKDFLAGRIASVDDASGIVWTYGGNFPFDGKTEFYEYRSGSIPDLRVGETICATGQFVPSDSLFHPGLFVIVPQGTHKPLRYDLTGTIVSLVPNVAVRTPDGREVRVYNPFNNLAIVTRCAETDYPNKSMGSTPFVETVSSGGPVSAVFLDAYSSAPQANLSTSPVYVTKVDAINKILWTSHGYNVRIDPTAAIYEYKPAAISDLATGVKVAVSLNGEIADKIVILEDGVPAPYIAELSGTVVGVVPRFNIRTEDGRSLVINGATAAIYKVAPWTMTDPATMLNKQITYTESEGVAKQIIIENSAPLLGGPPSTFGNAPGPGGYGGSAF